MMTRQRSAKEHEYLFSDEAAAYIADMLTLRANDDETSTCREFTLEGRGHDIQWLCP
jgi:hypothetical protein